MTFIFFDFEYIDSAAPRLVEGEEPRARAETGRETLAWKSVEAIVVEYAEQAVKAGAGALG